MSALRTDLENLPIRCATVPLILVMPSGECFFASGLVDKRELVERYNAVRGKKKAKLIAVWPGQWHSDAFEVTKEKASEVFGSDREFFKTHLIKQGLSTYDV